MSLLNILRHSAERTLMGLFNDVCQQDLGIGIIPRQLAKRDRVVTE
ncbi:MAG: hypothetical protein AB4368_31505 [Xenococcaceae cyanobacterium]